MNALIGLLMPSAVVRTRLRRKLNEAIQLVVTRGADADTETGKIIFKQSDALESKWLLRGSLSIIPTQAIVF
jgi:hypothetical protein